jgi:hypothetical protein
MRTFLYAGIKESETFDHGLKLLIAADRMKFEGIVSKRRDAPYRSSTGSTAASNTIGIIVVAALAASAAGVPPVAMTLTWRRTRSAANGGSRSF